MRQVDAAQRWPQDGRGRWGGRVDLPGQDGAGGAGAPRRSSSWRPRPVRRVYIPKAVTGETAPTRHSRDHGPVPSGAGRVTRWNPNGRPGSNPSRTGFGRVEAARTRSRPFNTTAAAKNAKRLWVLDADLAAAFDRIDHDHLLYMLGSFPARDMIRAWLKAGVFEKGKGFAPTEEGTPQGGVISPLLLNVALHGLEEAAGVRYRKTGPQAGITMPGCPGGGQIRRRLFAVLPIPAAGRTDQGEVGRVAGTPGSCHQRGQDPDRAPVRRGSISWGSTSAATDGKLLIKPSKAAIRRLRKRLAHRDARAARLERGGGHRRGSTRSSGVGPPTTGARCPARCSPGWTTTCGSSPTSGPNTATRTSRRRGWSPATSASSTSSGTTGGCSATPRSSARAAASRT